MILLPRLRREEVQRAHNALVEAGPGPERAPQVIAELGLRPHWNRSGGIPATEQQRSALAEALRQTARDCGFPAPIEQAGQQAFDRAVCRILADNEMLAQVGGDTLREACWAGITVLDVPDLAIWRHQKSDGSISIDRLRGGVRNFLRRLWLRNRALMVSDDSDARRWELVDALSEDAVVQIIERPALSANPVLAQVIARVWKEFSEKHAGMEEIMRVATKRLRARNEILLLGGLESGEIMAEVLRIFEEAVRLREAR